MSKINEEGLPIIYVSTRLHRGRSQYALRFKYNKNLKQQLLRFDGLRWSRSHRCFYIPGRPSVLDALMRHCQDIAEIQSTGSNKSLRSPHKIRRELSSVKSSKNEIDPETFDKIKILERWMEQKRYSYNTIKTYLSFLKKFFAGTNSRWNELTKQSISDYNHQEFIVRNKSFSSQNQWINAIKMFIKVVGINHIPLNDIERPFRERVLPNVLTQDEVKRLFQCTPNLKHQTLLMLVYSCGLRIGEALDLQWADIRRNEGLIYIRRAKGRKDRRVPLSEKLVVQLERYYRMFRPKKYVFVGAKGGKYSRNSASQVLKRSADRAKIRRKITLHTLRHSFATHLTKKGVNIQYIQEILGHNSPKTTMIYTHLGGRDIRDVGSPLDDMDI